MLISDIEKKIHALGYTQTKRDTAARLIVYMEASERINALKAIAEALSGRYTTQRSGTGWRSSVGATFIGNNVILAKPSTGGKRSNIASIDARVFFKLGTMVNFEFGDKKIRCASFTNSKILEKSILNGLRTNSMLGEAYAEAVQAFFDGGNIAWAPDTPLPIINKLGVYLGELLIGWVLLSQSAPRYFMSNPFKGRPSRFLIPDDPSFSGVDSFIEMYDKSYYAISSKYGAGAKASFFTNLFEKGIKNNSKLRPSAFKNMCVHAQRNSIGHKSSGQFTYSYGIYEILNISKSKVQNPYKVYEDVRHKRKSKEVDLITAAILGKTDDAKIKESLPNSISAYFTRAIADELNNNAISINQMKEILSGKDYWQANLNIGLWSKGEVKFKLINSGDAILKIYGNKSAIDDITAKQGWINYELKYP